MKGFVCGDVDGNFKQLFNKIGGIHRKKGPFEYLLCVGNFFGTINDEWPDVLSGKIKVPLTTYVLGPNKEEHVKFFPVESSEMAPNLIYLGKQGILTGSSGLRIAYLSGVEENKGPIGASFNSKDISKLVASASGDPIDILLTSPWPKGVTKYAKEPECGTSGSEFSSIAHLAKILKPRYHFAGCNGIFYERIPYRNHQILQETPVPHTRFIGLAQMNNKNNFKWIYAFNISPITSLNVKELLNCPGPVTECPFQVEEEHHDQFFYDMCSPSESQKRGGKHNRSQKRPHSPSNEARPSHRPIAQDECWFCLTNPKLEKHLLISIGEHSYVALAKGGLIDEHLLIVPTEHVRSIVNLSEFSEKEINSYKTALVDYFHQMEKDVVFFERNFSTSHLQINVVPIPKRKSSAVKSAILNVADSHGIQFSELSHLAVLKQVVLQKPYIYFENIVDKKSDLRMLHIVSQRIPINFGRMVLANQRLLDVPDRVDWNNCKLPKDEEVKVAEDLQKGFEPYDFSLSA